MSLKSLGGRPQPLSRDVRVNLLPPEIAKAEKAGAQRRLLVFLAIVSLVVAALGTAAATVLAATAQAALTSEEARATLLTQERAKYAEAQYVAGLIQSTEDAQRAGALGDVDWAAFVRDIIAVTPPSLSLTQFDGESSTVTLPASGPQGPLESSRLGLVHLVSQTADATLIDQWVQSLKTLEGYVGSTVERVDNSESDAGYTLTVTVYFDNDRLRDRYPLEGADDATESDTEEEGGDEG